MITTDYSTAPSAHARNDWGFLPTLFSAMVGVGIGILLGITWGWV